MSLRASTDRGGLGEPIGPVDAPTPPESPSGRAHHEPILTEHLFREERGVTEAQGPVELPAPSVGVVRPFQVDADRSEERPGDGAVVVHGLEVRGAAVQQ